MTDCENCSGDGAIEKKGKLLCLTCWIEELGRHRSTGTMERVHEERRRRERTQSAAYAPSQRTVDEYGGVADGV